VGAAAGPTTIRTRCANRARRTVNDGSRRPSRGAEYAVNDASDQFRWSSSSNSSPSNPYRTGTPDPSAVRTATNGRWNRSEARSVRSRVTTSAGNVSGVATPARHDTAGRPA
jgi:hypothetical protein